MQIDPAQILIGVANLGAVVFVLKRAVTRFDKMHDQMPEILASCKSNTEANKANTKANEATAAKVGILFSKVGGVANRVSVIETTCDLVGHAPRRRESDHIPHDTH